MKRILFYFMIFILCLKADDSLVLQKQNTLYIQNLIEIEEKIAKSFEEYLLTEFKFPEKIDDLIDNKYLGENFSLENKMGSSIDFLDIANLKIKYLLNKDEYRKSRTLNIDNYLVLLYNRDLYRNLTSVYEDKTDMEKSFIKIRLQNNEAKTIYTILKSGEIIEKECSAILVNKYCNQNKNTLRWYNATSLWIEYDKNDFENGNVTTSMSQIAIKTDLKINNLASGSYIFLKDSSKYIKFYDSILKVK